MPALNAQGRHLKRIGQEYKGPRGRGRKALSKDPPPFTLLSTAALHGLSFIQGNVFSLSGCLRVLLILYSLYHDKRYPSLPYTDIDYHVFNDAARAVVQGGSPYERGTYRYPFIFSWLLAPGVALGVSEVWGKALFALGDLGVGALLVSTLVSTQGVPPSTARLSAALYLLSPMAAITSTRGSGDSLACALVLAALCSLLQGRLERGGVALGLAVHLRLYPIIYALPCALHAAFAGGAAASLHTPATAGTTGTTGGAHPLHTTHPHLLPLLRFSLPAALAATLPTLLGTALYGWDAIQQAYLHHASRVDVRHNFSPLWLPIYAASGAPTLATAAPWSLILALGVGAATWRDLPAAFFFPTLAFVATNRVITAQYFLWWQALLPLILVGGGAATAAAPASAPAPALSSGEGLVSQWWVLPTLGVVGGCVWLVCELTWVSFAVALEVGGRGEFLGVWGASLLFLAANALVFWGLLWYRMGGGRRGGAGNCVNTVYLF